MVAPSKVHGQGRGFDEDRVLAVIRPVVVAVAQIDRADADQSNEALLPIGSGELARLVGDIGSSRCSLGIGGLNESEHRCSPS